MPGPFFHIPLNEIRFEFSRSGGKGGQNVNKVETRVQAFWRIADSHFLTAEQKERGEKKLSTHMNWRGEVMSVASSERSQAQNRQSAVVKLNIIVRRAFVLPKKRRATKPTLASKKKRIEGKILHSRKKNTRAKIIAE